MANHSAHREMARIATDPDAFEAFYRRHVIAVERFLARRVDDPHLVADLTADVFLAVIDSAGTYQPSLGDPTRWLYGVARNVVAADRRRRARELRAVSLVSGRALVDPDDLADLHSRIDAEAQVRGLYEAIQRLADVDRDLLEMVALDGLRLHHAAKLLGLSPVAARVRWRRARRALQDRLSREVAGRTERTQMIAVKEASP